MDEAKVEKIAAQVIRGLKLRVNVSKQYGSGASGTRLRVEVRLLNYNGDTIAEDSAWIPMSELRGD